MKRHIGLLLVVLLFLPVIQGVSHAEQLQEDVMIGDHVYLGSLEQDGNSENGREPISWTIIDLNGSYCILITDRIIKHHAFDTSAGSNTNWTSSAIRSWMTTELFSDVFSESEQAIIVSVKTGETGEYINNYESSDKIFLLSEEQAKLYVLRNECRVIPAEQKDFTVEQDKYHREEWWLRTSYGVTKKNKEPRGTAAGKSVNAIRMGEVLGVRPVVVVEKSKIKLRQFQLPERDEYDYLMYRVINKTAPSECMERLHDKTVTYLSEHYDKAYRAKIKRSRSYVFYLINSSTGEVLSYDNKGSTFTPSYSISFEEDTDRYSKLKGVEAIDMETAARGFFD